MLREKEISRNAKLADMRARHEESGLLLARGDLVCVVPSRGLELKGLLVDTFDHALYGRLHEVLVCGEVHRFEAERISGWRG